MAGGARSSDVDAELRRLGAELARQICVAIPGWVEREVGRIVDAWAEVDRHADTASSASSGGVADRHDAVLVAAAAAGRRAAETAGPVLDSLLTSDVDAQRATPLQVVRELVGFPTAVLAAAGVPPLRRDPFAEQRFPDDPYGLTPASLGALDPALTEPSMAWGAAKAFAHRQRHQPPAIH